MRLRAYSTPPLVDVEPTGSASSTTAWKNGVSATRRSWASYAMGPAGRLLTGLAVSLVATSVAVLTVLTLA